MGFSGYKEHSNEHVFRSKAETSVYTVCGVSLTTQAREYEACARVTVAIASSLNILTLLIIIGHFSLHYKWIMDDCV